MKNFFARFYEKIDGKKIDLSPLSKETEWRHRAPNEDELVLGYAWGEDFEAKTEVMQMKGVRESDRHTHCYVIGGSGGGKTKFLETLIFQDISKGNGFGVIDPHGDLVEDVKGLLALQSASDGAFLRKHVVLLDPTEKTHIATFNPLQRLPGMSSAEQAAELVGVFKKIWADSWGPRMEQLMRASLTALSEAELTLAELPKFITDSKFRAHALAHVENEVCLEYFEQFEELTPKTRREWAESTLNKTNAFLSDDRIRDVLAAGKSTFNIREIMDEGKILLVKLDRGRLHSAGDLLGALIVEYVRLAAFSRGDTPQSKRRQFYLYIDEFQNYANDSFVQTLAEARKYRLALIMAHQNLAQLPVGLRASVLANCGLQIYFRMSRDDAQLLAKEGLTAIYSSPPGWEDYIQMLQQLAPRTFAAHNKKEGGVVLAHALDMPSPHEMAKTDAEEFSAELAKIPIGADYITDRESIRKEARARRAKYNEAGEREDEDGGFGEPAKPR